MWKSENNFHLKKQLQKSGKVVGIYAKVQSEAFYIKSKVMPSYAKTGAAYTVKIIMENNSNNILNAICPCPAGVDGRCNHLAATLFAIENIQSKANTQVHVPCTSQPCKWSVPPKRRAEPTTIQEVNFQKHVWGKREKSPSNAKPFYIDVRVPGTSHSHDFNEMHQKLKKLEEKNGKKLD